MRYRWRCGVARKMSSFTTDRGGRYCSALSGAAGRHNLYGSMSAKGLLLRQCLCGKFLPHAEGGMYPRKVCQPGNNADNVFNYIECDYNRWRRHGACGGLSRNNLKTRTSLGAVSTLRWWIIVPSLDLMTFNEQGSIIVEVLPVVSNWL